MIVGILTGWSNGTQLLADQLCIHNQPNSYADDPMLKRPGCVTITSIPLYFQEIMYS
jgi:hypothetical protein